MLGTGEGCGDCFVIRSSPLFWWQFLNNVLLLFIARLTRHTVFLLNKLMHHLILLYHNDRALTTSSHRFPGIWFNCHWWGIRWSCLFKWRWELYKPLEYQLLLYVSTYKTYTDFNLPMIWYPLHRIINCALSYCGEWVWVHVLCTFKKTSRSVYLSVSKLFLNLVIQDCKFFWRASKSLILRST